MVYNRISDSKNALNIVDKYRKLIPRGVKSDNFEVENVQNAPLDLQNELCKVKKEVFTLQIRFFVFFSHFFMVFGRLLGTILGSFWLHFRIVFSTSF